MLRLFLPVILGYYVLNKTCMPFPTDETKLGISRGWIWPMMLVLVGIAWESSNIGKTSNKAVDAGFAVLLGTMCWWFWLSCYGQADKSKMVLILVAATAATLIWITAKMSPKAALLLGGLVAWIILVEHLPMLFDLGPHVTIQMPHYIDGSVNIH